MSRTRDFLDISREILFTILDNLSICDLMRARRVCRIWYETSSFLLSKRKFIEAYSWNKFEGTLEKHPWYDICGNQLLSFHISNGLANDLKDWIRQEMRAFPFFTIFFTTGVTYLNYLAVKNYHFVVYEELNAVISLHKIFPLPSYSLAFTTLKVIHPENVHFSLLNIPLPPSGCRFVPFHVTTTYRKYFRNNEDFSSLTGIDLSVEKILGIVILNLGDCNGMIRRVYRDFGPFPLIGCDSEALCWYFENGKIPRLQKPDDYKSCTSGFVITGTAELILSASIVLDHETTSEEAIGKQLEPLIAKGLVSSRSWALLFSSCIRGFGEGEDINRDVMDRKNKIQKLECSIFKKIANGTQFMAAQVEDICGVNYFLKEKINIKNVFPELILNDTSSVVFVVKYV